MDSKDSKLDLVNNGIETIKFIQEHREEIQKTYGRSQISKPTTKERTAAWETHLAGKVTENRSEERGGNNAEDNQQGGSPKGNHDIGQDVSGESVSDSNQREPEGDRNNKSGDGEDSSGRSSGTRDNSTGEDSGASGRGHTESDRAKEPRRGNPFDKADYNDYERIVSMDEVSDAIVSGLDPGIKVDVREATPEDIASILSEEPSRTHRRLRGVSSIDGKELDEGPSNPPVKKGHRREYCIDVFQGRTFIREWCNPSCSRITVVPKVQDCVCGQCPRQCPNCEDD